MRDEDRITELEYVQMIKSNKQYYSTPNNSYQGRFDKNSLPVPIDVINKLGLKVGKLNEAGYYVLCCPFHKNGGEKHPSFNLHHQRGNYRCHTCGVKGGNIVKLYCEVTKKSFKEAAIELGTWREK